MDIIALREYCLSKHLVEESFPFNETTLVFKVAGKMFLLVDIESRPLSFNVKCDPAKAIELREKHASVTAAYHMNKQHWNSVKCDGSVPLKTLLKWVDDSYDLIVSGLPKKTKAQFE